MQRKKSTHHFLSNLPQEKYRRILSLLLCVFLSAFFMEACRCDSHQTKPGKENAALVPKAPTPKAKTGKFEHEYLLHGRKNLLVFDGVIEKVSSIPNVEEMDYDDLVSTLKVSVKSFLHGKISQKTLVIQIPVVRDRTPLPAAKFAKGDTIRFSAIPWEDVVEEIKTIAQVDNVMDYNSPIYFAMAHASPGGRVSPTAHGGKAREEAIHKSQNRILNELQQYGNGDWERWRESLEPLVAAISKRASQLPENRFGKHGLIVEPTLPVEIVGTPSDEHPGVNQIIAFERELRKKGIDFIYVSIPRPWMIYPENITDVAPATPYVTPNYRQNLLSLLQADVEVVDTLPSLLAAKKTAKNLFYKTEKTDLHPPMEAMGIVATLVAKRLARYGFAKDKFEFLTTRPAPGAEELQQIISADGLRYGDDPISPLLFIGDSTIRLNHPAPAVGFTGQLAMNLGFRPSLLQRNSFKLANFAKESASLLEGKQVVVWVAWSLCLNKVNASICWKPEVDWTKSRIFSQK